jgi:hypothetical protein
MRLDSGHGSKLVFSPETSTFDDEIRSLVLVSIFTENGSFHKKISKLATSGRKELLAF